VILSCDCEKAKGGCNGPSVLFLAVIAFFGGAVSTFLIQRQSLSPASQVHHHAEPVTRENPASTPSANGVLPSRNKNEPAAATKAGATTSLEAIQAIPVSEGKAEPEVDSKDLDHESPPPDLLPTQVLVSKGEGLSKIIARHYPQGQERTVLDAVILANPEINRENVILPGQAINLPKVNFKEQTVQLQDGLLYALYGSYYSAASWKGDKLWLEKKGVRFLVRITRDASGRMIHRVFLGGFATLADLQAAQHLLKTKSTQDLLREKSFGEMATPVDVDIEGDAKAAGLPNSNASLMENDGAKGPSEWVTVLSRPQDAHNKATISSAPWLRSLTFEGPAVALNHFCGDLAALNWQNPSWESQGDALANMFLAGKDSNNEDAAAGSLGQLSAFEPRASKPAELEIRGPGVNRPVAALMLATTGALFSDIADSLGRYWNAQISLHPKLGLDLRSRLLLIFPSRPMPVIQLQIPENKMQNGEPTEPLVPPAVAKPGSAAEHPTALPELILSDKDLLPKIERYLDAKGALHIQNQGTRTPNFQSDSFGASTAAEIPLYKLNEVWAATREHAPGDGPIRKASCPGDEQNPQNPARPNPPITAPPLTTEVLIRRYRDAKGILHIVNGEPKNPNTGTTLAEKAGGGPNGLPVKPFEPPPGTDVKTDGRLPFKYASFPKEGHHPLPSPKSRPPEKALLVAREDSIRGYLDARGVFHISNAEPKDPKPINLSLRQNATALPDGAGSVSEREKGLPLSKVSWPGREDRGSAPGTPPRSKPRDQANRREGSIRRYRDGKGVLHIESTEPPGLPSLPLPRVQAIPGIIPRSAAVGPGLPQPVGGNPQPQALSGSRVIASRDKKGRLTIRNLDPGYPAEKPNPTLALTNFEPIIIEAALSYSLPVYLIHAVIKTESNFVPWAVSPKGAMGLMQLMPGTADSLGVRNPFCPRENILAGCRYLRILLNCFHDNLPLALAAYNAGYQRVISAGLQVPPIKETREFVTQVLGLYYLLEKQVARL
jgi:hypothetical protein